MLLVLDIGNTSISYGVINENKLILTFKTKSKNISNLELFNSIQNLLWSDKTQITNIAVASVLNNNLFIFDVLDDLFDLPVFEIDYNIMKSLIKYDIENPQSVGVDRVINTFSAVKKLRQNVVVIDIGTAITWDAMTADYKFLGGAIAPGIYTALSCLIEKTDKLINVAPILPDNFIGKTTEEAIQIGIVEGWAGMIERVALKISNVFGSDVKFILTGGNADLFSNLLNIQYTINLNLTLYGISEIVENYNKIK